MRSLLLLSILAVGKATWLPARGQSARAAYFFVNNPAGDSLVSLKIGDNGKLSSPVLTSMDGTGAIGTTAMGPSTADSLFSQDSVVVSGNYIFAVNPGSHTLSLFSIPEWDPWHPRLIGTADTKGDFPIAVTYSEKINTACVLNAGARAGVTCYSVHPVHGLIYDGVIRSVPVLHQTTPPLGPPSTGSDIVFNPSSTGLFVTVKGNPGTTPPTLGTVYIWPVSNAKVLSKSSAQTVPSLLVAFSATFLGCDDRLLVTDPAYGAAILSVSPTFQLAVVSHIVVPKQGAICWGVYSPRFDSAYLIDGGSPTITIINPASGKIKEMLEIDATSKAVLDSAVQREWLYVRAADGTFLVIDQGSGKEVQKFNPGLGSSLVGMAVWPKED